MDFKLHSLGWKAFQDLCVTILGEVLGQTIQQFHDSKDGGRDGAFSGVWHPQNGEEFSGQFTVQCKFTAKRDKQLGIKDLKDELTKARRLAERGLATTYILMTNASVTGTTDEVLRKAFLEIRGIERFASYGYEWISRVILESARLRMLVPRIYGIGDLSQILDERAYAQATEILSLLGDDLAKFVITDAHRKSAQALVEHGFVLLLGEPASGKSTIAAALAVAAVDEWGCRTLRIRDADEFVSHSNPHEPKQFFWVDDAFGATQFDHSAAAAWNRIFSHMHAAIRRGARVVFTSRDYIYRAARYFLKESAFPQLTESQVIIQVEQLSKAEREQILYNHIRLGRQPATFRTRIKPHLANVAAHPDFKPEIARRLSDPLFTKNLVVSSQALSEFVARPLDHLMEIIRTLDAGGRSALAVVFMRGGLLPSPLDLVPEERRAVELIGGSISGVREALNALNESLVLKVHENGSYRWRFKHPTVQDAFASLVATDVELLDIYLSGSSPDRLLSEVSCGEVGIEGVKVIVPQDRYDALITRFDSLNLNDFTVQSKFYRFLARRCDRQFLERYLCTHPSFVDHLRVWSYLDAIADIDVIVRLYKDGLLSEDKRRSVVQTLERLAVDTPDAGFLDEECRMLFRDGELEHTLGVVKNELIGNLDDVVDNWRLNFSGVSEDDDADGYFQPLVDTLKQYREAFEDDPLSVAFVEDALKKIERVVAKLLSDAPSRGTSFYTKDASVNTPSPSRSIFDDVDQ